VENSKKKGGITMSRKKVIICAALSGAGTYRNQNPAVPHTPEEFAEESARCYKAGAAMVHVHARDTMACQHMILTG